MKKSNEEYQSLRHTKAEEEEKGSVAVDQQLSRERPDSVPPAKRSKIGVEFTGVKTTTDELHCAMETTSQTKKQEDSEVLDRILWRLVNTEEKDLENVLSKLVPMMIQKMNVSSPECGLSVSEGRQVQQRVLNVLSHVNSRLNASPSLHLPLEAIWDAYVGCRGDVMAENIGMVYVGKGFVRCGKDEVRRVVGRIVNGIHERPVAHQGKLLVHAFQVLSEEDSTNNNPAAREVMMADERDVDVVVRVAERIAMYKGKMTGKVPSSGSSRVAPAPGGLSDEDVGHIVSWGVTAENVQRVVLGALWLVQGAQKKESVVLMFLLAAASSPYGNVSSKAESVLAKTCVVDTARPTVDVEDVGLVRNLYRVYLGTMEDDGVPEARRRQPAGRALKGRIVGILCKSVQACQMTTEAVMVIHDCLFGGDSGVALQQQGMQFAVHVLKHAQSLEYLAPSIIHHSLRILDDGSFVGNWALRSFAYQCLGQLAQRDPMSLEQHKMDLMRRCFDALLVEPPGVRASAQETVNCLSNCFKEAGVVELEGMRKELTGTYIKSENVSVRQAALLWMIWIFPFHDSVSRYYCMLLSSDGNVNISDLALEGLDRNKAAALQRGKFGRVDEDVGGLPSIDSMLETIYKQNETYFKVPGGTHDLFLPAKSLESMVAFLATLPTQGAKLDKYFLILSSCIIARAPGSLHNAALDSLLRLAVEHSSESLEYFPNGSKRVEMLLSHVDATVAIKAARLIGYLSQCMSENILMGLIQKIESLFEECKGGKSKKQEDVLGLVHACGFILAWRPGSETDVIHEKLFDFCKEESLQDGLLQSVALLSLGYSTFGKQLKEEDIGSILDNVVPKLLSSSGKIVPTNISTSIGLIAMNCGLGSHVDKALDIILNHSTSKDETLLDACGDTLIGIWGGLSIRKEHYLLRKDVESGDWEDALPVYVSGCPSSTRNRILKFIVNNCISSTRTEARLAGSMWLLKLVESVFETTEISSNIAEIQRAFCLLLGDSNERTQEMASKGVTTSYKFARDDLKEELVKSLVDILSGNQKKWMRPSHVDQDTQIFEPGSLGSLPDQGGGISTYKEICSLATDLGQPDLIYQFMNLASHQAAADASRGAAYGMASVASIAGDALKPYMGALIPRLYRSTFDPNPLVRDSMKHIWLILIDDQKQALSEHLPEILRQLTSDMTRSQWRVRESAALAMSDALQGLVWDDVKSVFDQIVLGCFRIMDDVKESVRLAGQSLSRSIASLSVRLTESGGSKSTDSEEFLSVIFSTLINCGIPSDVSDVRNFSINMIAKLTKSAGKDALLSNITLIVPPLLEALSGMEDSRLNYMEQHVQRLGVDGDKFEEARIRFSQGSPIGDTLEMCAKVISGEKFCQMSSILCSFIKKAVGSATKSGTANFVISSVRRLGEGVSPVAWQLMRTFYEASTIENSASVKKSYAIAYANLSQYAPRAKMDHTVDSWLASCKGEDVRVEFLNLTGTLLKSLSIEASDVFLRYSNDIAPLSFMLQYDSDSSVAATWLTVWDEVTTATGAGARAHVHAIIPLLLETLLSGQWSRRKASGEGIVYLTEHAGDILGSDADGVIKTLLNALPGRLWEGKEILLKALGSTIVSIDICEVQKLSNTKEEIVDALLVASGKQKLVYRAEALSQLARVLKKLKDFEFYPTTWPVLKDLLQLHVDKPAPKDGSEEKPLPNLSKILDCIAASWVQDSDSLKFREPSYAEATASSLLPLLQQCDTHEDIKSLLQTLSNLMICSKEYAINEAVMHGIKKSASSILCSSKVETVRSLAIDLLQTSLVNQPYNKEDTDVLSNLQDAVSKEKSLALRSKIQNIMTSIES